MYELKTNIAIMFLAFVVLVCSMESDFVFANNNGEVISCMETERESLLKFKEGLIDKHGMLSSWGRGKECCKWEGIQCSNTNGHVIGIELVGNSGSVDDSSYYLGGEISSGLLKLHDLKVLKMSGNDFGGNNFPKFICFMSQLQHLNLASSNFSGILPSEIGNLTNLSTLDLSSNQFAGTLPIEIGNLTNLHTLDLSSNSLEDIVTEANLAKLHNLKVLDLSFNSLSLVISPDWTPPFQLSEIGLSGCKLGPHFPTWLRTNEGFRSIDLSNNRISGEVPKWFWSLSHEVTYLNLSHNQLNGAFSDLSSIKIEYIDVSANRFSGPIPLLSTSTRIFQISKNMFSGPLSFTCSVSYEYLLVLDLNNNRLAGKLPSCWENMNRLQILNLASNNFSGEIPHAMGSLTRLKNLHLANNNFFGELPSNLKNCKQLRLICFGDNMLTGSIPAWIGEYHEAMVYLILRNNRFHGSIPPQICYLSHIRVLDLSGNNMSGKIPPCFNNFTYMVKNISNEIAPVIIDCHYYVAEFIEYTAVLWKRTVSVYRKNLRLLKLIDLSNNRLDGDIPSSFSSLKELHSLNLSRNRLTGIIDPDIGQMGTLESLDLSSNQLFGAIPVGMAQLNFLTVLDLSDNNLSGKIPTGTQLQLFNASAYAGNIGLCESPLQPCPRDSLNPSTNNEARNDDGILSLSFLNEFGISIILGFIFGFWGVVGSLIVNESWRKMFYNFVGACIDWLFVRVTIFCSKLRRSS